MPIFYLVYGWFPSGFHLVYGWFPSGLCLVLSKPFLLSAKSLTMIEIFLPKNKRK